MRRPRLPRAVRPSPSKLRRFDHASGTRASVVLPSDHRAVRQAETLFLKSRIGVEERSRLLKSGHNSRKIGKVVTKGRWRGFPIYTLTLEERATCPGTCVHWRTCYGNNMPFAERFVVDDLFEEILWLELAGYAQRHPRGFVVRLHVLGDFYSVAYVDLWQRAIETFRPLHVFGYTARPPKGAIGRRLMALTTSRWDRFAIRFSGVDEPELGAVTIEKDAATEHVVCPAQRGGTECCGTCGFCWHSRRTVAFERH